MQIITTQDGKQIEISDEKFAELTGRPDQVVETKKYNFTIKNRWTGDIIFQSEKNTWKEVINEAIGSRADLTDANLTRADLTDADLTDANLTDANLTDANLTDANLTRAEVESCLFYFGNLNKNLEALFKVINTIKKGGKTLS